MKVKHLGFLGILMGISGSMASEKHHLTVSSPHPKKVRNSSDITRLKMPSDSDLLKALQHMEEEEEKKKQEKNSTRKRSISETSVGGPQIPDWLKENWTLNNAGRGKRLEKVKQRTEKTRQERDKKWGEVEALFGTSPLAGRRGEEKEGD